jgi:hypothetical protein
MVFLSSQTPSRGGHTSVQPSFRLSATYCGARRFPDKRRSRRASNPLFAFSTRLLSQATPARCAQSDNSPLTTRPLLLPRHRTSTTLTYTSTASLHDILHHSRQPLPERQCDARYHTLSSSQARQRSQLLCAAHNIGVASSHHN